MKQPVRLFSIGLMTAGVIMLIVFMITQPTASKENMSTKDMISKLENEQYHVLSEEEYISMSVNESDKEEADTDDEETSQEQTDHTDNNSQSNDSNNNDSQDNKTSSDETDEDQDTDDQSEASYTVEVKQGMSSRDISSVLEQNGIIDNQEAFNDYLQENDYGQLIQIGTSEVNSSMSFHELAETLSTF